MGGEHQYTYLGVSGGVDGHASKSVAQSGVGLRGVGLHLLKLLLAGQLKRRVVDACVRHSSQDFCTN
jgi:hypothetical protein